MHEGDLFDTACRLPLPERCRAGAALRLQLELCSPLHDDGALIHSWLVREPDCIHPDRDSILLPESLQLHRNPAAGYPRDGTSSIRWNLRPSMRWRITWLRLLPRPVRFTGWAMPIWISPGSGRWADTWQAAENAPFDPLWI